jgi:hypothetical protein
VAVRPTSLLLIIHSCTTTRRLLNEPRAEVVGIAWVVECVEQRIRVDEARFRVDLENMNMAGTNKVSAPHSWQAGR